MSEQAVEKVGGSGEVVGTTTGTIEGAPVAHTSSDGPFRTHIKWYKDPRPTSRDDATRSLDPYWEISIYTEEEMNAIREADKLDPDLAKYYKDLLED
jgi:hypothetical protein